MLRSSRFTRSLIVALLTTSATYLTNSANVQAQPLNCQNPSYTFEMKACAQKAYEDADKQVNQVYNQILPGLNSAEREKLITAQLAWIKFRDTNCAFEVHNNEGGNAYSAFLNRCLARVTQERTQELQQQVQSQR